MENTRKNLLAKCEELLEKLEETFNEMEEDSYRYSQDLGSIIEEVAQEMWSECPLFAKIREIENAIGSADAIELEELSYMLEDIETDIFNIEFDSDRVIEKISDYFIYYYDAWEYLKTQNITEFEDAFRYGYYDICGIATYYLMEEFGVY